MAATEITEIRLPSLGDQRQRFSSSATFRKSKSYISKIGIDPSQRLRSIIQQTRTRSPSQTGSEDFFLDKVQQPVDSFHKKTLILSNAIKRSSCDPPDDICHDIEFSYKFERPDVSTVAITEVAQLPGHVPLSTAFHLPSHRERADDNDDGLEDADLTAADGIIRRNVTDTQSNDDYTLSKRHSLIYDTIKLVKGDYVFPHRTYRPKVQVPFKVPHGQTPQAVAQERLHRAFKKTDINVVLSNLGLSYMDLLPVPYFDEESEKFLKEMQWRQRTRILGVDKLTFLENLQRPGDDSEDKPAAYGSSRYWSESLSGPSEAANSDQLSRQTSKHDTFERLSRHESVFSHMDSAVMSMRHSRVTSVPDFASVLVKTNFGPNLPLDMFDNNEYDTLSGNEWIKLGFDRGESKFYPIPGKAFLPLPPGETGKKPHRRHTATSKKSVLVTERNSQLATRLPLSEITYGNVLNFTERLRKFRNWLLQEKYDRMTFYLSQNESEIKQNGGDGTIALPNPEVFHQNPYGVPLGPSILPSIWRFGDTLVYPSRATMNPSRFTYGAPSSMQKLYSNEVLGELEDHDSSSQFDILGGNQDFFAQFKRLTLAQGKTAALDDTTDLPQKSQSLLSEIFSDPASLPLSGQPSADDAVKSSRSKTSAAEEGKPIGSISDGSSTTEESEQDNPDYDPYENAYDKVIFEFDKMKKINVHDWKWVDVAIFQYDDVTNRYLVRSIYPPVVTAWVSKLYLFMDAEDPYQHAARIKDAIVRRQETESLLRYSLCIDCLSLEGTRHLPSSVMKTILMKILDTPNIKVEDQVLKRIQHEIDLIYRRTQAELEFEYIVNRSPTLYEPWIQIPESLQNWRSSQDWEKSLSYRTEAENLSYMKAKVQKLSVIFKKEPFECLVDVMGECIEVETKYLLQTRNGVPLRLFDYLKVQESYVNKASTHLGQVWLENILAAVRMHLSKIPNSWYNIAENRWEVYLMTKTSSFLKVVKYMMELAIDSLRNLVAEIQELTVGCDVDYTYSWGDNLIDSEFPPPNDLIPTFRLELILENEGPKYSELLDLFPKAGASIIEEVLKAVGNLPDIVPKIMTNLLFGTNNHLQVLEEGDPVIVKLKTELLRYIRKALIPVDRYAQQYKRYLPLWHLHLHSYLHAVEKHNPTAQEMKRLVEEHNLEYDKLEAEIPNSIDIACFRISTETVKQNILKKKKQIVTGLLDQYAGKLKHAIHKIREEYVDIEKKLKTRSDDIEEVMHLKDFVETVPVTVLHRTELLGKLMKDYDLFEKFNYSISAEDFDMKWSTSLMSSRLLKLAEEAVSWLDEDFDRLVKVQQQDMSALSDAVDSAFLSVAGLGAFLELEKATEVAAEVKKIWKHVNELREQNELLNRRQQIFGFPAHQNEALIRLIRDIEPFKSLWFTAADWQRVQEIVFKETLDKVDVRAVKALIDQGRSTMRRCVRYFKGADSIQHIAQEVLHQIESFKVLVPLISTLKNQGMRQRHWEAISEICGFTVVAKGNQNFQALLDQGMQKYVDEIAAIGEIATKEFAIETKLESMVKDLSHVQVQSTLDQSIGVNLMSIAPPKALDTISKFIRDTEKLQQSEFKGPFEEKLNTWQKKINVTMENMELWFQLQQEWVSIIPHFKTAEALTQMPAEYKLYGKMERIWRRLHRLIRDHPEILDLGSDATVRASLLQFSSLLLKVQKGLEEHLRPDGSSSDDDVAEEDEQEVEK